VRTLKPVALLLSLPPTLLALLGAPASSAWAAEPARQVQPVPYTVSQPVPYATPGETGQPPPLPPPAPVTVVTGIVAAGSDVVVLKEGGMIRGTLLEVIPNDHATVQLATGQSAVIQWDHIERIDRAKVALPVPVTPTPVVRVDTHTDARSARVHIESDRAVTLERHEGGKIWSFACTAPCDVPLSVEPEYRIVGDGVRKSAPFHLAARPGEAVTLDVNTATKSGFAGGIVLTALGPIVMLVGVVIVAVAGADSYGYSYTNGTMTPTESSNGSARTAGWITLAAGGVGTVGGILMITGNAHSSVYQAIPRREVARNDAWKRLPIFHDDPNALATPRGVSIPLLGGSF
jgi:hypothetical protein